MKEWDRKEHGSTCVIQLILTCVGCGGKCNSGTDLVKFDNVAHKKYYALPCPGSLLAYMFGFLKLRIC